MVLVGKDTQSVTKNDPVTDFISHLDYMFKGKSLCGMKALDIACGPGQYAKLLKKRGFDVDHMTHCSDARTCCQKHWEAQHS